LVIDGGERYPNGDDGHVVPTWRAKLKESAYGTSSMKASPVALVDDAEDRVVRFDQEQSGPNETDEPAVRYQADGTTHRAGTIHDPGFLNLELRPCGEGRNA
jgi:hypothetical protein